MLYRIKTLTMKLAVHKKKETFATQMGLLKYWRKNSEIRGKLRIEKYENMRKLKNIQLIFLIRKEVGGKGHIGKYIEIREHIKNYKKEIDPSNRKRSRILP